MNNTNVQKINKIGKVTRILVLILRIVLIIGIVGTIVGGCISLALPNDFMSVKADGTAQVVMKNDEITKHLVTFGDIEDLKESNLDYKGFGYTLKWIVTETENTDDTVTYDIDAKVDGITGKEIKFGIVMGCFGSALLLALALVSAIYGGKLAKALETCNSPFEENVTKAMKAFGISLIPWAVLKLFTGSFSGFVIAILVLVVLLFVRIFKYGAELQKQSDETL